MKPEDHTAIASASPEATKPSALQQDASQEEVYQPASLAGQKPETAPQPSSAAPLHGSLDDAAAKVGRWAHRNQDFFNGPVGWFSVKQVARSLVASAAMMTTAIPVFHAFDWMNSYADKIKGAIKDKDFSKVAKTATLAEEEIAKLEKRADLIKMVAGPEKPYKAILYVAAGFSMYRGTTKIFNKLYEKLFNPKNDEQQTIEEVRHIPGTLKDAVKEVAPAELQSTPFAAVALGGLRSVFPAGSIQKEFTLPSRTEIKEMGILSNSWRQRARNVLTTIGHKPGEGGKIASAFLGMEVPLNWLGYFTFFELGDRLFKDVQLRRGYWKGDANTTNGLWRGSTTNLVPDAPPAPLTHDDGVMLAVANVEKASNGKQILLTTYEEKGPHGSITNDPSAGRLLLRSAPPVVAGISAYLGLHKLVKLTLGNLEPAEYGAGFGKNLAKFAHNFKVEWVAIGMFFAYAMSKELWENWYDKHVVGQRKTAPNPPLADTRVAETSPALVPTDKSAVYSPLSEKVEPGAKPGANKEKPLAGATPETRISSVIAHEAGHGAEQGLAPQLG